ncbi:hypothetical protein Bca4012_058501 [Brassica carinata]|uniref:Uncharacterized protein n=1 Tax=Brassica carinata TaxID=52824 RepID=A0A8X7W388_BRACI|nr:hypothetical protein Bca52824_016241 [Brassica carinata]
MRQVHNQVLILAFAVVDLDLGKTNQGGGGWERDRRLGLRGRRAAGGGEQAAVIVDGGGWAGGGGEKLHRFQEDPRQPSYFALKEMQALFENLSRMKESSVTKFKTFQIPVDWMLETGITSQIKPASVKLAMKYMKRVSAELEAIGGGGPEEEELIV